MPILGVSQEKIRKISSSARSRLKDQLETAKYAAASVVGHRIHVGLDPRIFDHLLYSRIAPAVLPDCQGTELQRIFSMNNRAGTRFSNRFLPAVGDGNACFKPHPEAGRYRWQEGRFLCHPRHEAEGIRLKDPGQWPEDLRTQHHAMAIAARYDKYSTNFLAGIKLAAIRLWCEWINESTA